MDKLEHRRYVIEIDNKEIGWWTVNQMNGDEGARETFRVLTKTHKRAHVIELIDVLTEKAIMTFVREVA